MNIATVTIEGDGQTWTGPLREYLRENEYDLIDTRPLIAELREHGSAIVGGGAAPPFRLTLANRP